jgi:hypothetical protein
MLQHYNLTSPFLTHSNLTLVKVQFFIFQVKVWNVKILRIEQTILFGKLSFYFNYYKRINISIILFKYNLIIK